MTRQELLDELQDLSERLTAAKQFDAAMMIVIVKGSIVLNVESKITAALEIISRPIFDASNFDNKVETARLQGQKDAMAEVVLIFKNHFGITDEQIASVWPEHFEE